MADDSSSDENYLASIYEKPYCYRGILWGAHTNTEILRKCENFSFRADDVIVATYPRSGTTLTQEIIWQIVNHEMVNKDEKYENIMIRVPFLEFDMKLLIEWGEAPPGTPNPVDFLPNQPSKRLMKTHLPYFFVRDQIEKVKAKVVVVMRNPKDNVVSSYNFFKGLKELKESVSFADYWQAYMRGKVINGDYCEFNREYWKLRDQENVLIVRYEDIVHLPFQEIRKIALFLGYSLSAEKISTIVHNTTFSVMSKNEATNVSLSDGKTKFMRQGKAGVWKDWLTVAQNEAMDKWISENFFSNGPHFTYE